MSTVPFEPGPDLLAFAEPERPLAFVRRGDGIVGIGEAARLEFSGPERIALAAAAWRELAASARVDDTVRASGSGLVAFGAFAFADSSAASSVLVVPRLVVGRRGGRSWLTRIDTEATAERVPLGRAASARLRPGAQDATRYLEAVRTAIGRIAGGGLAKVVLARDLVGELAEDADPRHALGTLAGHYPDTWTYSVDGMMGSSPETLVSVSAGTARARVLAGSAARGEDPESDARQATALATSTKDLDEHGYAVRSVLAALRPFSPAAATSELPFTLKLPNLWHLASDVEGALAAGVGSLDLVAALHPTAAVAGTPRERALALIAELEPVDRGRYAGPVGWIDASGDGEWAIALRGAQLAGRRITAFAGAGIVADSVPERELAETALKFRPILEAFSPAEV